MKKRYYVTYTTKDGDIDTVWVEASSKKDAEIQAKQEYWDIDSIIRVQ